MQSQATFVLIHSPLVGPSTWSRVAATLHAYQIDAVVPSLSDSESDSRAYWQQHAHAVARELASIPTDRSLIVVGHSGAGPLLPCIRQLLPHHVSAYIFVDAGIPHYGASRLDLIATESPTLASQLHNHLETGGRFPEWTDAQLQTIIPSQHYRQQLLAEVQPRGLPFFMEPIPVFPGWPDATCVYIELSSSYASYATQARQAHWPVYNIKAHHFHMLTEPEVIANLLMEVVQNSKE